jgi:beta-phosphoglucomutase
MSAIIFDFDGTLVDTEPIHERALIAVCQPRGARIREGESIGLSDEDAIARGFRNAGLRVEPDEIVELCREKVGAYLELIASMEVAVYEGALEALRTAGGLGPVALCTAAMRAEADAVLERLGVAGVFDAIVTADDVEAKKPDPAAYRLAMERLGVPAALAVEDSPRGVDSAVDAGCYVVAVEHTTPRDRLARADEVIARIADLSLDAGVLARAHEKASAP